MTVPEFYPALGFGLCFLGVNIQVGGLCNMEQLVSSDHHLSHFIRVMIFLRSGILLCSDDLMVMPPHSLVVVTNLLELSFIPELALPRLQGTHTLFLYILVAVLTATSSVSEHMIQSPEADSMSESLLGVNMGQLVVLDPQGCHWRSSHAFSGWDQQWILQIGTLPGECQQRGYLKRRHWKRWSSNLMSWTVWGVQGLWALWLRYSDSHWDVLFLLHSGG